MSVERLIESALEEAGTVIAIIASPERGSNASIHYVNQAFARLFRRSVASLQGELFEKIGSFVPDQAVLKTMVQSLVAGLPSQLDLPLFVDGMERWLGLRLIFPTPTGPGTRHAIITGRDITQARRMAKHEEDQRRLLASIFIRINAPVAIVTTTGEITMANPAFHQLVGYTPEQLKRLRVEDLTPPEYAAVARAARARQLIDGQRYEMQFETLAEGGGRIAVWLTSVLLRDGDQRMRVVTLIPDSQAVAMHIDPGKGDVGELHAVSLEAFRSVFGNSWQRVASRAMMKADQIIRRKIGRNDTVSRADDYRFIIWFESNDRKRNEIVLADVVREVRLSFLTEFGEQVVEHVSATIVPRPSSQPEPEPPVQPKTMPPAYFAEPPLRARRWGR